MDIRKLQRAIVDGLEDVKAHDIRVFNTEHLSPLFERVIVASGTSNRQTKALASSVRETVKSRGLPVMGTEGEDNGEWIIVDCGAAVAHIMQPAIRQYYNLEEIWGEKAVRMKADGAAPKKTAITGHSAAGGPTAKKAAAKKAPSKTPSKKTGASPAAPNKAPGRKPPASKTAKTPRTAKTTPSRSTAPRKAAAPRRGA